MSTPTNPQDNHEKKSFWQRSLDKCKDVAKAAGKAVDDAAELAAKKCSELTGKNITKDQVKAATAIAGVLALGMMANAQASQAIAMQGGGFSTGEDFESQTNRFFAENGVCLRYETPYVDSEGQVYS